MNFYIDIPKGVIIQQESQYFKKPVLKLSFAGQYIIPQVVGDRMHVSFLKHQWSGIVEVTIGESKSVYDLYSISPEVLKLSFEIPSSNSLVVVQALDPAGFPEAGKYLASEVWIGDISFEKKSLPVRQGVRRINDVINIVDGVWGNFMIFEKDEGISRTIEYSGVWAEKDIKVFERFIRPGMVVVDIGANIGHHTVVFSKIVGPTGKVFAFEPQNQVYQLLNANLILNNCSNAFSYRLAVGESPARMKMWPIDYTKETNFGSLGISQVAGEPLAESEGENVEVVTGDIFFSEIVKDVDRIDFIKIDVQTFELYVLKGLKSILTQKKPILFLEISPYWMKRTGYDYGEIYRVLWDLGYDIFRNHEDIEHPENIIGAWNGDENHEWDILAIHSSSFPVL